MTEAWSHRYTADGFHNLPAAFSSGQTTLQHTQAQALPGGSTAETAAAALASNAPLQHAGQDFRSAAVAPPQTKDQALGREGTAFLPLAPSIPPQGADADIPASSRWILREIARLLQCAPLAVPGSDCLSICGSRLLSTHL
jgi:hypothetical protein